jgi:Nitrogen permease regulator 2
MSLQPEPTTDDVAKSADAAGSIISCKDRELEMGLLGDNEVGSALNIAQVKPREHLSADDHRTRSSSLNLIDGHDQAFPGVPTTSLFATTLETEAVPAINSIGKTGAPDQNKSSDSADLSSSRDHVFLPTLGNELVADASDAASLHRIQPLETGETSHDTDVTSGAKSSEVGTCATDGTDPRASGLTAALEARETASSPANAVSPAAQKLASRRIFRTLSLSDGADGSAATTPLPSPHSSSKTFTRSFLSSPVELTPRQGSSRRSGPSRPSSALRGTGGGSVVSLGRLGSDLTGNNLSVGSATGLQHGSNHVPGTAASSMNRAPSSQPSAVPGSSDIRAALLRASQISSRPRRPPKPPEKCPLFCVFYAEFDIKVGRRVRYQTPRRFMNQDIDLSVEKVHEILAETFHELQTNLESKSEAKASENESNLQGNPPSFKSSASVDRGVTELASSTKTVDSGSNSIGSSTAHSSSIAMIPTNISSTSSIFDACSEYIITSNDLSGNILNMSTHHFHVVTRPTVITNARFERNAFLFCIGFILRRTEDPRPFRPVLSKLAMTLRDMETESQFLSNPTKAERIQDITDEVLWSLNGPNSECYLVLDRANALNLKLFRPPKLPAPPVPDFAVPILLRKDSQIQSVSMQAYSCVDDLASFLNS